MPPSSLQIDEQLCGLRPQSDLLAQAASIGDESSPPGTSAKLVPPTPNRKRKSMSTRSGQSGTVVRKGQMWHGRYYADVPGQEKRRFASVPLGSVKAMKKTEAKRKLRAMLEEMGLNEDRSEERRVGKAGR